MNFKAISAALIMGAAALTASSVGSSAGATTLTVDSGWQAFYFDGTGSSWDQTFTFTLSKPAVLNVVDAFRSGDQFSITGIGATALATSLPTSSGDQIFDDADGAFNDPLGRWSRGSYLLMAGMYTISGSVIFSPYSLGEGFIELTSAGVSAVPLPAALPLFGAALGGLGMAGRRTRRRRSVS